MAKIKRLGVLKTAFFLGIFLAFMGLIMGLLSAVVTSLMSPPEFIPSGVLIATGYLGILIWPIGLGITGFVYGLIFALIVNLVLKIIKGFSLDIDMTPEPQPATPTTQEKPQPAPTTQVKPAVPVKKISVPKI